MSVGQAYETANARSPRPFLLPGRIRLLLSSQLGADQTVRCVVPCVILLGCLCFLALRSPSRRVNAQLSQ